MSEGTFCRVAVHIDIEKLSDFGITRKSYELQHENSCFWHMQKQFVLGFKGADQLHSNRTAVQRFCFCYIYR